MLNLLLMFVEMRLEYSVFKEKIQKIYIVCESTLGKGTTSANTKAKGIIVKTTMFIVKTLCMM